MKPPCLPVHRFTLVAVARDRPIVIAHRTCPLDAPENSLEGIQLAAVLGADAVECDVRRCRDGVAVLTHDAVPWRTTRSPWPVRWLSSQTFTRLRRRADGGHPPTLEQAVRQAPEGLRLAFDVKDPSAMPACLDIVLREGAGDRAMLWCRDPRAVALARDRAPDVRTALLRDDATPSNVRGYLDDAAALGAAAVSLHERLVSADVVAHGQGRGLTVYAWARSVAAHAPMVAAGVDGLVTDWPTAARDLVNR
jgi:glycerophosphoryl diester phosphodiesterase